MTRDEAEKVLKIMMEADGGCPHCAAQLAIDFADAFPEHRELAKEVYWNSFELELFDEDMESGRG